MGALSVREVASVSMYAANYGIPVMYDLANYGSTLRKMRGKGRYPDWVINPLGELRDIVSGDIEARDFDYGYSLILWSMTGNWGFIPLAVLGVSSYTPAMEELYSLTRKYIKVLDNPEELKVLQSCVRFMRDFLGGKLRTLTAVDSNMASVGSMASNSKFPRLSTGGDLMVIMSEYETALKVKDNNQLLKYLAQDILFEPVILHGISLNQHASIEVLERVIDLLDSFRMDYTNTPESDYYRSLNEIRVQAGVRITVLDGGFNSNGCKVLMQKDI